MPYRFLDEIATADTAFEAWAPNLENLFADSVDAMMNVMVADLDSIKDQMQQKFEIEDATADMLLFKVLQEIIYYKDSQSVLFRLRSISIYPKDSRLHLRGTLFGEHLSLDHHQLLVDVKAVTLHNFSVKEENNLWKTRITLDI